MIFNWVYLNEDESWIAADDAGHDLGVTVFHFMGDEFRVGIGRKITLLTDSKEEYQWVIWEPRYNDYNYKVSRSSGAEPTLEKAQEASEAAFNKFFNED